MGMTPGPAELLPGETVVLGKNANAVIALADHGLAPLSAGIDKAMGRIGMAGAEAIGGRLYLTNYRLLFKSHAFNRVRGAESLYLPGIRAIHDSSSGLKRQVTVVTARLNAVFVVWGVAGLISAVERAKAELEPAVIASLENLTGERFADGPRGTETGKW